MFYGSECSFGGRSSSEYGLMVYDFGQIGQEDVVHTAGGKIISEHVAGCPDIFLYGIDQDEPLKYTLVLCANEDSVNSGEFLDRFDVADIASWLTGHQTWQWLLISQPDMETFRYKCVITDLKLLSHGSVPWAFSCVVTCNSPYAYTYPEIRKYTATPEGVDILLRNRSTHNGFYYPKIELTTRCGDIAIVNHSDGGRALIFSALPATANKITIENRYQIITDSSSGMNLYNYFNRTFFRLARGNNQITLTGDFDVAFLCEFPVDVGG